MNLGVELAGIQLKNPVMLASGTAGYGFEFSSVMDLSGLGGIVLKSVTLDPRRGNPEPRIWETSSGMLNSIGLENVGIEEFVREVLPKASSLGTPVFASIAGETVRAYARLAKKIDEAGGASAIEVNVSCPNVEKGGLQFGADEQATLAVTMAVCENCELPVFVKLSAAVANLPGIARAAGRAGAAGLSLVNTIPGMAIDVETRRPRLGAVTGGLSGPAIKPIGVKAVHDCYEATNLPILGSGGIFDAGDVVEYMIAGASAVAIGTASFHDPGVALEIIGDLPRAVAESEADSPAELTGTLEI